MKREEVEHFLDRMARSQICGQRTPVMQCSRPRQSTQMTATSSSLRANWMRASTTGACPIVTQRWRRGSPLPLRREQR